MIIARWMNQEKTFAVNLIDDGTLTTSTRKSIDHVWSPPSDPVPLDDALDEFKELLELINIATD